MEKEKVEWVKDICNKQRVNQMVTEEMILDLRLEEDQGVRGAENRSPRHSHCRGLNWEQAGYF